MRTKRVLALILTLSLLAPVAYLAADPKAPSSASSAASAPPQTSASSPQPQTERPQPRARQRSYQRETRGRHTGISKKEWLFLGAVAGTSMGIGALAAGGKGVAIGALVGGWAAYGAHKLWGHLK